MKLLMYPETQYEEIKFRFGLEGIEPEHILVDFTRHFSDCRVLAIVINMAYPCDVIEGGLYLNPRILKMLGMCFEKLGLCLVHLGHYPRENSNETSGLIVPIMKCEWFHDFGIYLLVNNKGDTFGKLMFADLPVYLGDFYGEDAVVFIFLPEELNLQMADFLKQFCEEQHIKFTEYPEAVYKKKVSLLFREKIFTAISKFFK